MQKSLTAGVVLSALLAGGCFESNDVGVNQGCTSNCFMLNGIENEGQASIDKQIKAACERMGRKGTPEIRERTKTAVAGYCPE